MTLPVDSVVISNVSSSQNFTLKGGLYLLACMSSSWSSGSATVEFLGPDGRGEEGGAGGKAGQAFHGWTKG